MSIIEDLKLQVKIGGVVTKLIFWNILLFAIPTIVFGLLHLFAIDVNFLYYISLSSNLGDLLWKPWSVISYAFFHSDIFHILFNLLMLNFSGRLFLTFFTQKQLLSLYFVGAIFAGIIYLLGYQLFPSLTNANTSLIGASASVMAILFATVAYAPFMEIRLLIFGQVKLWHIALVLVIVDLVQLPMSNTGGHLSHLGGAIFGCIYIQQLKKGRDICAWFSTIVDVLFNLGSKKATPFKKVHKNYSKPVEKSTSRIIAKDKAQQQIDEILDKISQSGYDSLTKEEKEFLFKAGK
ncbi:rhomboid family intramembrane serine protease [Flavobacterium sp. LB1P62]|uniref:rhomboid family intramembrane serine protease n=1 Tax=Flavobacterium sp. LB1P62 TaxID=3401715 RepID=UPI003AAC1B52